MGIVLLKYLKSLLSINIIVHTDQNFKFLKFYSTNSKFNHISIFFHIRSKSFKPEYKDITFSFNSLSILHEISFFDSLNSKS